MSLSGLPEKQVWEIFQVYTVNHTWLLKKEKIKRKKRLMFSGLEIELADGELERELEGGLGSEEES